MSKKEMFFKEDLWRIIITICGMAMIFLTIAIGAFLLVRGTSTFFTYDHSIFEFIFSSNWAPKDTLEGGGTVGALVFICGSLLTCGLAILIATPFSLAAAIFMTEISPTLGKKLIQPAVEIFVGIPSVVYGWTGLTILVPLIKNVFNQELGLSVLAAALVLSIMIFPTITTVSADAIRSVNDGVKKAGYGLGSTRYQVISRITLPAAKNSIITAIVLGLARAFGEALAVAMVIGRAKRFPTSILDVTTNITAAIASDMGSAMEGGELNSALWSLALLLFIISILFIFIIHKIGHSGGKKNAKAK